MKIYLVGGAVRDKLLGRPVKEKDFVVVGATPADMLKKGFRQVGKDFPVFLHPETNEEYALARMERKVGRGYTGFEFDASPSVTLEEDLLRRDLTINAMAESAEGALIDPFHGQADLKKKLLRHVSPAFIEDPVRILRLARFAARFSALGFTVAPETMQLMQEMVTSGEVDALVAERVWKELERALQEEHPEKFFEVLEACGALSVLFPQLKNTNIVELKKAAEQFQDDELRFSVLLHHLTAAQIKEITERYRVPASYRDLALLVSEHLDKYTHAKDFSAEQLLNVLLVTDAFRRGARFEKFLNACLSITGQPKAFLDAVLAAASAVTTKDLSLENLPGNEIGKLLNSKRIDSINNFLSNINLSNK